MIKECSQIQLKVYHGIFIYKTFIVNVFSVIKFIRLFYDEISPLKLIWWRIPIECICYHKEKLSHQEILQLVSDRADLLFMKS